jgi:hypothetical protein
MYDIIGDIHGYAKTLEKLLVNMGYTKINGVYSHPENKAIFVGDFIDRGPAIRESLQIVKSMVDGGFAHAVMGNHEYNAICFNTPTKNGKDWLRKHSSKNIKQHTETMVAFIDYPKEWMNYLEWFMSLPLFLDFGNFRIVHACWDNNIVTNLNNRLKGNYLNMDFIHLASKKGSLEYHWIENLLKGFELTLPDNIKYSDKDGFERSEIRVKWWKQLNSETYRSISVNGSKRLPEISVLHKDMSIIPVYSQNDPPVFIGHYWNTGKPELMADNVCCVDYSIARGGKLVAYRWNGESSLKNQNFVIQECMD